jgi:NAD+ kinase
LAVCCATFYVTYHVFAFILHRVAGGFPITLRHRLHCTIVRGANSRAACLTDSSSGSGMPCVSNSCVGKSVDGEEHVSLNEVVIERGISPFLTNLECFCDGAFVTHVQVRLFIA